MIVHRLLIGVAILLGLAFVVATTIVGHPALIPLRPWLPLGTGAIVLALGLCALLCWRTKRRVAAAVLAVLAATGLGSVVWQRGSFALVKARVLATSEDELRAIGRHLVVGYTNIDELRPLVTKAAIAGVFISKRNAQAAAIDSLAADITFLQDLRARFGLPPLWIGSDQEGGLVSSLSPPLARPRPLSALAADMEVLHEEVTDQAQQLACLGTNVNFAPVVDVDKGIRNAADRFSRIGDRSISADPALVARTARLYCGILANAGVQCTLKHFPGLGGVAADTHVGTAVLPGLVAADVAPFEDLTRSLDPRPWVMLSHAIVASLDPDHPASASRPVIDILRKDWSFDGVIVTDDIWMAAYRNNLGPNLVGSLSGGADLILISYDPDLAYTALDTLLRARRTSALPAAILQQSDQRLEAHRPPARNVGCAASFSHLAEAPSSPDARPQR
ncbi:MAG: glycoside hydrolase family 3 N-terminal domain-containing protein [Xanthobacteraceae bacterium]